MHRNHVDATPVTASCRTSAGIIGVALIFRAQRPALTMS
jgi:hypothetical protein